MTRSTVAIVLSLFGQHVACAQRLMEKLERGVVAVRDGDRVFVSWRLFATDPPEIGFNVYRQDGDLEPTLLNDASLSSGTNFVDATDGQTDETVYSVRPVIGGREEEASAHATVWRKGYLEFPIRTVDGYRAGDASVADLDGDGQYEIVLHQVCNPKDNSHPGITGSPILDAYELDGTFMWRIDLGRNIREGEHYTQLMVYDLDGDGNAEVACKTADGTVDGLGRVIGDANRDYRVRDRNSRAFGRVLEGPEFLTIFSGRTGEALKTVDYIPGRDPIDGWGGIGGNAGNDS